MLFQRRTARSDTLYEKYHQGMNILEALFESFELRLTESKHCTLGGLKCTSFGEERIEIHTLLSSYIADILEVVDMQFTQTRNPIDFSMSQLFDCLERFW